MQEMQLYAKHYKKLGLNVTCISNEVTEANFYSKNLLKAPNHNWRHLTSVRQHDNEYNDLNWNNATGVGCVSGYDSLVAIDIDGCTDYSLLDSILDILQLPRNYEWVTQTGSKNGFHVIVKCENNLLSPEQVVTTFPPNKESRHLFEKIEILWKTHVILPPSLHKSGNIYSFLNCRFPLFRPREVDYDFLFDVIRVYLNYKDIAIGTTYGESVYDFKPSKILSDLDEGISIWNKTTFCIVDIETDGLPQKSLSGVIFPNVVQVAWLIMDIDGKVLKKDSELVHYPNLQYTEAFSINKINLEMVRKIGKPPTEVYRKLISDLKVTDYVVAHNTDFDLPILSDQFKKYQLQDVLSGKRSICTMRETVSLCQIPSPNGEYSFPKLSQLYKKLFNYEIQQSHNAISDVLITTKCFKELLDRKLLQYGKP
jgi:DNA polymerase III epsilon subunit-like protein